MVDASEPSAAARRQAAREAARQRREQQERRARRQRVIAIVASLVALLVVAGAVAAALIGSHRNGLTHTSIAYGQAGTSVQAPAADSVTAPAPNAADGLIINNKGIGNDNPSDVHVTVYLDFQCPYCGKFEQANGPVLAKLIGQGGVTVVYHPLAFLDRFSKNTLYSTRAANAAAVVAHGAGDKLLPFLSALYAHQPGENTPGLTDAQIADAAREAGVPDSVLATFTNTVTGTYNDADGNAHQGTWRTYSPWVYMLTQKAEKGFGASFGTPLVMINGQQFTGDLYTPGPLEQAISTAQG